MRRRRRTEVVGATRTGAPTTGPIGRIFDLDRSLIDCANPGPIQFSPIGNLCTCGAPGGWYGHERHCGEVEPASEYALPAWQHTSTDAEDLEF